jgi:membrane protein required for colicin V production
MIDVLVGTILILLVIRGWMKGLIREAIDVGTLIVGAVVAFRLAPISGRVLSAIFGMSPESARLVGGVFLFVAIWVGASVAGILINRSIKILPGLSTLNRLGGAALGAVYTAVLVVIALTLMSAAPLPSAIADELDRSAAATYIAEPVGPAQRAFGLISGDRALQSMAWIRDTVDAWVIDPTVTNVTIPVIDGGAGIHASSDGARSLFDAINSERDENGLEPLEWSDATALVATTRAYTAYRSGSFVPDVSIENDLAASGVTFAEANEGVVLAATNEGLAVAFDHSGAFTYAGVGVVEGPYGLIAVVVTTA